MGDKSWHSAVRTVTWLLVRLPTGTNDFSFPHNMQTGSEAHPHPYSVRTGVLPREAKRLWGWGWNYHTPTASAEVPNQRSYTATLRQAFTACTVHMQTLHRQMWTKEFTRAVSVYSNSPIYVNSTLRNFFFFSSRKLKSWKRISH